jgi:hypothetical protein
VLINKNHRLAGITSSCMKLLKLDIAKQNKLNALNIGINKIAPSLFGEDNDMYLGANMENF